MTNAKKFNKSFGMYATELWAMPEEKFLKWLNCEQKQTNADLIRAMTDEELAKKISGLESFALTCGGGWPPDKWLEWLREEVKE